MPPWDQLRPVVLGCIDDQEVGAGDLRDRLASAGIDLSPLAFLGMLAVLERTRLVFGRRDSGAGFEAAAERRRYRLTAAGVAELAAFRSSAGGFREAA